MGYYACRDCPGPGPAQPGPGVDKPVSGLLMHHFPNDHISFICRQHAAHTAVAAVLRSEARPHGAVCDCSAARSDETTVNDHKLWCEAEGHGDNYLLYVQLCSAVTGQNRG